MPRHAPLFALLLVFAFAGCSSPSTSGDGGASDGAPADAGITDAGSSDAGITDAGITDAGTGDAGTGDAGITDAGTGDAGITDAGTGDAGSSDAGVACGAGASSFPTFTRTCVSDSDCTFGIHQINCCGSRQALGMATSEASAFAQAEASCEAMYPACGCAASPLTTDNGTQSPVDEPSAIVVHCVSGQCTTSVRPQAACDGATCSVTQACLQECSGVPLPPDAGPLPSSCVDIPAACATSTDCSCFGTTDPCPTGQCVSVQNGVPLCVCQ